MDLPPPVATAERRDSVDRYAVEIARVSYVVRRWRAYWIALTVVLIAPAFAVSYGWVAAPLAVFPLQALVAEWLGARVDPIAVSAPRRSFSRAPFLTFGRRSVPLAAIDRLFVARAFGADTVTVTTAARESLRIYFETTQERREFVYLIQNLRPTVPVFRD